MEMRDKPVEYTATEVLQSMQACESPIANKFSYSDLMMQRFCGAVCITYKMSYRMI
jgi:hypothetical protein